MNNRRNPRHIMRLVALVMSIALIFSGITVFYAAEGDQPDAGGNQVTTPSDQNGNQESEPGDQGGNQVTTPSDQGGSQVTTPSDQSGSQVTTPSDQGGSQVTTPSDQEGTVTTPSDAEEEVKCPFCGSEKYDLVYDYCETNGCHEHIDDELCAKCDTCGGCTDNLYGVLCYKSGARCKACTCFELSLIYTEPSHDFSAEEVAAKAGKEEINVDLISSIYVLQDGGKMVPLSRFISDSGAKITERKVTMDSKYNSAVFLNVPALSDTENARFSYAFTNPIAAGNIIPMNVELTVEHNGISKSMELTFRIYITDGSGNYVKNVELSQGSEKLVLEAGETSKVVYKVTMDEAYKDDFYAEALCTDIDSVDFEIEKDLDKMELIITVKALEVGKAEIVVFVGEGEDLNDSGDIETRTIAVEVVEPSAPAAPGGSVYFDETTIKAGEAVRLNARGWYDGETIAESSRCYLPASWSVNPSGSWEIPEAGECPVSDEVMLSLLTQNTPELKNLAVKEHTGRITFQGYERKADGWYPVSDDIYVGSAKLKVLETSSSGNSTPGGLEKPDGGNGSGNNGGSNGGSNNGGGNGANSDGKGPGTGDIIRDNPGVRIAGMVMLMAGLLIFGTLAAERIYREMQARKRQAAAVRR